MVLFSGVQYTSLPYLASPRMLSAVRIFVRFCALTGRCRNILSSRSRLLLAKGVEPLGPILRHGESELGANHSLPESTLFEALEISFKFEKRIFHWRQGVLEESDGVLEGDMGHVRRGIWKFVGGRYQRLHKSPAR